MTELQPDDFIKNLMEVESLTYKDAIDKCQTLLERGYIYINPEGYIEITQKESSMRSKLGYSRIGRNNV